MGHAAQHSGGQLRLGVSATVASAVLYSAVVLFGLGSASPSAQGRSTDPSSPVVRVAPDRAVSGPGKRLPQVSPGPARRHSTARAHDHGSTQVVTLVAKPSVSNDSNTPSAAGPAVPHPKPKAAAPPTSTTESGPSDGNSTPAEPDPVVALPDLPVTVLDLPVTVPTTPLPLPGLPAVQVPQLPGASLL